jgi:hypothetical protein
MGIGSKLLKSGMVGGLAGMAADKAGVKIGDLARHGYFGLTGLALAKKKKKEAQAGMGVRDAGMGAPIMGGDVDAMMGRGAQRDMSGMKKGGKVKKMAKGGSTASKRADGCATKGKTKGRFV